MRLIDADKIKYYLVDRNGKHIGEMVWKPHIDGIETFNLEEHNKQIKIELLDKVAHELKETFNTECPINYTSTQPFFTLENVRTLVDMVIKDLKAEVNQ